MLFRYYRSENDILWGRFDLSLTAFEEALAALLAETPNRRHHQAVLDFNDFPTTPCRRREPPVCLHTPSSGTPLA